MADDRFKVVTNNSEGEAVMVAAGESPKGIDGYLGLTRKQADSDAKMRNEKAEAMGLKTRYRVESHTPPE